MAWDEWEQLKAEAATGSPHMQLNQLDPGSGPVRPAPDPRQYGELKASQTDLAKIGSHAFDLYNHLWNKGRRAVPTSESAAGKLTAAGFALGSALQHVALRWDEQLGSLRDACAHPVSCSESGKQKEYDAPSTLCGIPVDPNLVSTFLPSGKATSVQEKNPVPSRTRCQAAIDGQVVLVASQEWWEKSEGITDVADAHPQLDSAEPADDGALLYTGTGAVAQVKSCANADLPEHVLYTAMQVYASGQEDAPTMKKLITAYTEEVKRSTACQ